MVSKIWNLGSKFIHAEVEHDGLVLWKPFHVFISKCKFDSTYFPFEKQSCHIDFVAWAFDESEVYLAVGTDGVNTEDATDSNGQWELVSSSIVSFSDEGVSQIRATLVIKRKPLFFIINIILPIVLLSILNIFTFQIPADIGERMGKVDNIVKYCKVDLNSVEHYNAMSETDPSMSEKSDKSNIDWKEGVAALDFTCFLIFIIVLIISALAMLMTSALQS
ncbi:CHRNB4 [Mytilus edulis]|uniref:CHRNB4 n=1 Tax=Mytilus edulis TaxID=6550 RepID=A0A8S3RD37_MYTED|nr:CHRNB4 [Mytilus edulis]